MIDAKAVVIKLADRLHIKMTVDALSLSKQYSIELLLDPLYLSQQNRSRRAALQADRRSKKDYIRWPGGTFAIYSGEWANIAYHKSSTYLYDYFNKTMNVNVTEHDIIFKPVRMLYHSKSCHDAQFVIETVKNKEEEEEEDHLVELRSEE
nr:hypothetical protein [Tanacetum cinerariifolium]